MLVTVLVAAPAYLALIALWLRLRFVDRAARITARIVVAMVEGDQAELDSWRLAAHAAREDLGDLH